MFFFRQLAMFWLLAICSFSSVVQASTIQNGKEFVSIGVLAFNGKDQALKRWQNTADYLSNHIPSYQFEIVPLTHDEFVHAINKKQLNFVLTNPGHYIRLEIEFGATRIATFKSRYRDDVLTRFGSVIFVRSDSDIHSYQDFKGRSMAAVSEQAFGGFLLARNELLKHGLDVTSDLELKWLGFPQTDIVRAIISGEVDIGTVRSGILEKMSAMDKINLDNIRVLGAKKAEAFPLMHSTDLYPEWPIARLPNTDSKLAKEVAITLLQMPESAIPAIASGGAGWTIPLDYLDVHSLFRSLQLSPYPPVSVEFSGFWKAFGVWVVLFGLLFVFIFLVMLYLLKINRDQNRSQRTLVDHGERLEAIVEMRTLELNKVNTALQKDIESRVQFESVLHDGCEVLQLINTLSSRDDLTREQRLQSIIDMACHYLGVEIAVFSLYRGSDYLRTVCNSGQERQVDLLDSKLAQQAIDLATVLHIDNRQDWLVYLACPVYMSQAAVGLLELGTSKQYSVEMNEQKNTLHTEIGQQLLQLLAQWIANESSLSVQENRLDNDLEQLKSRFVQISDREMEVLQLVSNGESNKSIARQLDISVKTVELHRSNLLRKTHAASSVQMIKMATICHLIH